MDYLSAIAKIAGGVLLLLTLRSIYRHFFLHRIRNATNSNTSTKGSVPRNNASGKNQIITPAVASASVSVSEKLLNNILLYLWLAFALSFSIGLILNN
jgi:hypothetical protein